MLLQGKVSSGKEKERESKIERFDQRRASFVQKSAPRCVLLRGIYLALSLACYPSPDLSISLSLFLCLIHTTGHSKATSRAPSLFKPARPLYLQTNCLPPSHSFIVTVSSLLLLLLLATAAASLVSQEIYLNNCIVYVRLVSCN